MSIVRDRDAEYGDAVTNWTEIARMWSEYLGVEVTPRRAVGCMMLMKLQRLKRNPAHQDSLDDIGGYAEIWRALGE